MKLKTASMLFIGGVITILLGLMIGLVGVTVRTTGMRDSMRTIKLVSKDAAAANIKNRMNAGLNYISGLEATVNSIITSVAAADRRDALSSTLNGGAIAVKDAYSVWLYLVPGALGDTDGNYVGTLRPDSDPATGQYSYYAINYKGYIASTYLRPATMDWARAAERTDGLVGSGLYRDQGYEKPSNVITYALPIYDANRRIIGSAGVDFSQDFIQDYVKNSTIGNFKGVMMFIGSNGQIIASSDDKGIGEKLKFAESTSFLNTVSSGQEYEEKSSANIDGRNIFL